MQDPKRSSIHGPTVKIIGGKFKAHIFKFFFQVGQKMISVAWEHFKETRCLDSGTLSSGNPNWNLAFDFL
jgi:hypothetical protein